MNRFYLGLAVSVFIMTGTRARAVDPKENRDNRPAIQGALKGQIQTGGVTTRTVAAAPG